jgi:23S rRNA (cytidine1920-2'-O)/16S rRNA (cytidine1409-2'-O)-methyltransferase
LPVGKKRIDVLLVERDLAETRQRAQALIMAGEVQVDGRRVDKAGTLVPEDATVAVRTPLKYVGRGGLKLEGALAAFQIDPTGKVCADLGASTGGFTDCLLQQGAARVYAIDVGYGQLAWKLRTDPRVVTMDRVNIRYLPSLPEPIDLATIDTSFISVTMILPAAKRILRATGASIALIKPQFEAGRELVGRGGIVRDPQVHRTVLDTVVRQSQSEGWCVRGLARSPITGADGNVEFFAHLTLDGDSESIYIESEIERILKA